MFFKPWILNGVLIDSPKAIDRLDDSFFTQAPENLKQWIVGLYKSAENPWSLITLKSSGSTGTPKHINVGVEDLVASADLSISVLGIHSNSKLLLCLPLSGVGGLMVLVRAMRAGAELITTLDQADPLKHIEEQVDVVSLTPQQLYSSIDALGMAKTILVGGAPLQQNKLGGLNGFNGRIIESYGMTETLSHVALRERYPVTQTYFKAIGDVYFELDSRGALGIYTPHLTQKFYQTNDRAYLFNSTEVEVLGRLDGMINSGGVKIDPSMIRLILESNNWPHSFLVAASPHATLGEQLTLLVKGESLDAVALLTELSNFEWPKYNKPKKILCVSDFVYTHSGKVDVKRTLELHLK